MFCAVGIERHLDGRNTGRRSCSRAAFHSPRCCARRIWPFLGSLPGCALSRRSTAERWLVASGAVLTLALWFLRSTGARATSTAPPTARSSSNPNSPAFAGAPVRSKVTEQTWPRRQDHAGVKGAAAFAARAGRRSTGSGQPAAGPDRARGRLPWARRGSCWIGLMTEAGFFLANPRLHHPRHVAAGGRRRRRLRARRAVRRGGDASTAGPDQPARRDRRRDRRVRRADARERALGQAALRQLRRASTARCATGAERACRPAGRAREGRRRRGLQGLRPGHGRQVLRFRSSPGTSTSTPRRRRAHAAAAGRDRGRATTNKPGPAGRSRSSRTRPATSPSRRCTRRPCSRPGRRTGLRGASAALAFDRAWPRSPPRAPAPVRACRPSDALLAGITLVAA